MALTLTMYSVPGLSCCKDITVVLEYPRSVLLVCVSVYEMLYPVRGTPPVWSGDDHVTFSVLQDCAWTETSLGVPGPACEVYIVGMKKMLIICSHFRLVSLA